MEIKTITIIGAGTMGANIALNFAAHGLDVRLTDAREAQLEAALAMARTNAESLRQHGLLSGTVDEVVGRIGCVTSRDEALVGTQLVIEAIPENLELKLGLFRDLDRHCAPEVILASNTSTFMPSSLTASLVNLERAGRFLVMHYWNPAHLIPLVELVPHPQTKAEVLEDVKRLLETCGKKAVLLRKEVPGFIGNRLAFALQREAMDLVEKGVASPADIDAVASASFGRRIPVSGVFGTADLGGLDVYLAVCRSIFPDLCAAQEPPASLHQLVEQGKLGVKSGAGWSDYTPASIAALREALAVELMRQAKRDRGAT